MGAYVDDGDGLSISFAQAQSLVLEYVHLFGAHYAGAPEHKILITQLSHDPRIRDILDEFEGQIPDKPIWITSSLRVGAKRARYHIAKETSEEMMRDIPGFGLF